MGCSNIEKLGNYIMCFSVEKNGDVCISILHEPGDDKWGYEKASERWLPVHTVETILISVISMLADPNDESPANVDAAVSHEETHEWQILYINKIFWHYSLMIIFRYFHMNFFM